MRQKGNSIRLNLLPIRKNSTEGGNGELESKQNNENKGPLWLAVILIAIVMFKYIIWHKYFSKDKLNNENKSKKEVIEKDLSDL